MDDAVPGTVWVSAANEAAPADTSGGVDRPARATASGAREDPMTSTDGRTASGHGRKAAERASTANALRVPVPLLGTVTVPRQQLAFIAGVGALAALGILEWPIAAVLAAGNLLASDRTNETLHEFGAALEEA